MSPRTWDDDPTPRYEPGHWFWSLFLSALIWLVLLNVANQTRHYLTRDRCDWRNHSGVCEEYAPSSGTARDVLPTDTSTHIIIGGAA